MKDDEIRERENNVKNLSIRTVDREISERDILNGEE